ncbi:MAG TPA: hypothetical protein ENI87_04890 [bacterium]|nr:hypothetical protein [bacterium]
MNATLRNIFALLVALCLAVPANGDPGGENAGGTGVWILPTCAQVIAPTFDPTQQPRTVKAGIAASADLNMKISSGMGVPTATFVDDLTGLPIPLPVSGRMVTLPAHLMQSLVASPDPNATIVIVDANQVGYVIRVTADPHAGSVVLAVK